MNVTLIIGAGLLGFVIPEVCQNMGSGKTKVPLGQNIVTAIAFALIAAGL